MVWIVFVLRDAVLRFYKIKLNNVASQKEIDRAPPFNIFWEQYMYHIYHA